jgi:uncharacterized protein YciI
MSRGFAYFYFLTGDTAHVARVARSHGRYWHSLHLLQFRGGPFSDRSGGLITFAARDEAEAARAIAGDPFIREGVIGQHWLRPWDEIDPRSEAD